MNYISDHRKKEYGGFRNPNITFNGHAIEEVVNNNGQSEAKKREIVVEWLNSMLTDLSLPKKASDEELRAYLIDSSALRQILNRMGCDSMNEGGDSGSSSVSHSENVKRFLAAMDKFGLPRFDMSDLEKGSMTPVIDCLLTLRAQFTLTNKFSESKNASREFISPSSREEMLKVLDSKFRHTLRSPIMQGHKFHEVFQLKQGRYADIPAAKISEMMKPNSLDNAPTQSLLSVVNGILDESVERKNGEIPHRVACLLRKVVQEIERRISTQAQHLKTQNNLYKAREEKYQSRIRVLEALAAGISEETQIVANQLQKVQQMEKTNTEEKRKAEDEDVARLMKEKDQYNVEISSLKQDLELAKKTYELQRLQGETKVKDQYNLEISSLKQELEIARKTFELQRLQMEAHIRDQYSLEISSLKQELEISKKTYEMKCQQMGTHAYNQCEHDLEISSLKKELEMAKNNYEMKCAEMEKQAKNHNDPEISFPQQELEVAKKKYEMKCLEMGAQATDHNNMEISLLKQELETAKKKYEMQCLGKETHATDQCSLEISLLKQELETAKKKYEMQCLEMETRAKDQYSLEISLLKQELETAKKKYEMQCLGKETQATEQYSLEILSLKQELETAKKKYEVQCLEMETRAKDQYSLEVSSLKQELETAKKKYEMQCLEMETRSKDQYSLEILSLKQELETAKKKYEMKCLEMETRAKDQYGQEVSSLKQELENAKKNYEKQCLQIETQAKGVEAELEKIVKELERNLEDSRNTVREHEEKVSNLERNLKDSRNSVREHEEKVSSLERNLEDSRNSVREHEEKVGNLERSLEYARNKVKELETVVATTLMRSNKKERIYQGFVDSQFYALQELRSFGGSIKQEVLRSRSSYSEELNHIGPKLKALAHAAENYHEVLAENRRLFNEVQDLKGNIRVFCRVRPFLPGQAGKQTIIEHVGDNGELVIANPSKQGKDGLRSFKFNKIFGPKSTQAEVYVETQPFVRSVLDGFNACIFAYGQTGSGKTHTMSGPKGATKEEWGVNYRALDDLFTISQNRKGSIKYEVGVQMVEIYNEQVRDLLSSDGSQKKIGIVTTPQPNGLSVPDATLKTVSSTSDVMVLMDVGLKNRSVSATAMNERSSRSHSIVTIHVRGTDLKTGAPLRGSLHLVDLAGSERVDRSEVTGDRLKEAQHINKSLAALGDVIFALSQKSTHVPYRNSKLTQLLQSSLGGQAKTLMFVQVNPDSVSYTESLSTLKFAERVSGVELGAAKSSKDAKGDVKELMDQVAVASLKDTISRKDEEIEQLQLLKDLKKGVR